MRLGLAFFATLLIAAGCLDLPGEEPPPASWKSFHAALYSPATQQLRVVVHAHPGHAPSDATADAIVNQVGALSGKPVEVVVRDHDFGVGDEHTWTWEELAAQDEAFLGEPWPDGIALAHVLAMPGCFYLDGNRTCIGGVAGRVAHVFMHATEDLAAPMYRQPALRDLPLVGWYATERFIFVHELGHVFGLVGFIPDTIGRVHPDDPCGCHSDGDASVMAYSRQGFVYDARAGPGQVVEAIQADNLVVGYRFSAADLADAQAFRDGLDG